jgi:hypothetical protein
MPTLKEIFSTVFDYLEFDGDRGFIHELAQDAKLPSGGIMYNLLTDKQDPSLAHCILLKDWLNTRLLPAIGVTHKATLCELFPDKFRTPGLDAEVQMLVGLMARRGKSITIDELKKVYGDDIAAKFGKKKTVTCAEVFALGMLPVKIKAGEGISAAE